MTTHREVLNTAPQPDLFGADDSAGRLHVHVPTLAEIETARPTRRQLALWGVLWPPPRGWRKRLITQARARAA
jgi:hypothetical protein